jgi:phosphoglycolate phosphatase
MLRVVLFDLDGTLMDTVADLSDALNDTLRRSGRPPVDEVQVRRWVGDGARALLGKAMAHAGAPAGAADAAWAGFAEDYVERCGTRSTLHAGVRPMLRRLREQGLRLVLLTNKEAAFTQRLLARHDIGSEFELVVAGDTLPVKKPHPGVVTHVLQALDAQPDEAMLVGDSVTDVRTARAAGIGVQLVRHGYAQGDLDGDDRPDAFIEDFEHFSVPTNDRLSIS